VLTDNAKASTQSRWSSPRRPPAWGSSASGPAATGPRPTARWSGSTRACSMSGPMGGCTLQHRALPRLRQMAPVLQSPATTYLARRPDPDGGPRQQPWWELHLGQYGPAYPNPIAHQSRKQRSRGTDRITNIVAVMDIGEHGDALQCFLVRQRTPRRPEEGSPLVMLLSGGVVRSRRVVCFAQLIHAVRRALDGLRSAPASAAI
jgi:hypothetical protein